MAQRVTEAEIRKARLLALILPAAEREELQRKYGVRPALLSGAIGLLELAAGVGVYFLFHPGAGGGPIRWLMWQLNPITWLGLLIMVTGTLRLASFFSHNDSFGEPLVWLLLRLYQSKKRRDESRRIEREFGPEAPDRVVVDADGRLVLLASRAKRGWDDHRTVRIEDGFFKIEAVEERRAGRYQAVAYLLEEVPESEVLRGVVHTDAKLPAQRRASVIGAR